jgi:hypothetical protein
MKRKQNHANLLAMGEVKVFGIHKGRTPIDKSIWRTGLSYSRVATVTMPTLSGAMVRIVIGISNATEQAKQMQQSDGRL